MLLGYTVAEAPASPRNSTWFTRLFLLMRGWGLGMRLVSGHQVGWEEGQRVFVFNYFCTCFYTYKFVYGSVVLMNQCSVSC